MSHLLRSKNHKYLNINVKTKIKLWNHTTGRISTPLLVLVNILTRLDLRSPSLISSVSSTWTTASAPSGIGPEGKQKTKCKNWVKKSTFIMKFTSKRLKAFYSLEATKVLIGISSFLFSLAVDACLVALLLFYCYWDSSLFRIRKRKKNCKTFWLIWL